MGNEIKFQLEEYHRKTPEEELINDIIRVSKLLNSSSITNRDYEKYGQFGTTTIRRRFGSWSNALKKAGFENTRNYNITMEELFKNIENIWISLGRQPRRDELKDNLSKYSKTTYENRFGSWRNALKEFVKYINDDSKEISENVNPKEIIKYSNNGIVHRTRREISDRMRFRILMRDGFTCKKCGRSPMKSLDVELHVDHIVPWSKGGETIESNLETKCAKCNLGKGNAFEV